MSHLDEGTIVALRDGSLVTGEAVQHLDGCGQCQSALDGARLRAERVSAALATLDDPIESESAKAELRRRLDAARDAPNARMVWRRHVGRAAAILLVAAGAAYALPGSPVREWLTPTDPVVDNSGVESTGDQEQRAEGGIEVDVPDGRIHVVLTGVRAGSEVVVQWVEGTTARIAAAPGSSFSFGAGRAEASIAPGPVRVELPRASMSVSVEIDGRIYLQRTSSGLDVLEPTRERSDERIRFVIVER